MKCEPVVPWNVNPRYQMWTTISCYQMSPIRCEMWTSCTMKCEPTIPNLNHYIMLPNVTHRLWNVNQLYYEMWTHASYRECEPLYLSLYYQMPTIAIDYEMWTWLLWNVNPHYSYDREMWTRNMASVVACWSWSWSWVVMIMINCKVDKVDKAHSNFSVLFSPAAGGQ